MKKQIFVIFVALISLTVKADDSCSKYNALELALEDGDTSSASLHLQGCDHENCSEAQECLVGVYSYISGTVPVPQSLKVLETYHFDIAQKDGSGSDAFDDAIAMCSAHSLFYLKAYGVDKTLTQHQVLEAKKLLKEKALSAPQMCLLPFCREQRKDFNSYLTSLSADERGGLIEEMANKKIKNEALAQTCQQSIWVLGLNANQMRDMVRDQTSIEQTHATLIAEKFSDIAVEPRGSGFEDILKLLLSYNAQQAATALRISGNRTGPDGAITQNIILSTSVGQMAQYSEVDRMIAVLLQLQQDGSGIFSDIDSSSTSSNQKLVSKLGSWF